jgi:hypothetical protein
VVSVLWVISQREEAGLARTEEWRFGAQQASDNLMRQSQSPDPGNSAYGSRGHWTSDRKKNPGFLAAASVDFDQCQCVPVKQLSSRASSGTSDAGKTATIADPVIWPDVKSYEPAPVSGMAVFSLTCQIAARQCVCKDTSGTPSGLGLAWAWLR